MDGYHAIPLDQESQTLAIFITDQGRYMNLQMPQGFKAPGDIYTKKYDNIIKNIPNKKKIVDDTFYMLTTLKNIFLQLGIS